MRFFAELRGVAWAKRIALALEESNNLSRERMAQEFPSWAKEQGLVPKPKKVEIGVASAAGFNKRWREEQGLEPEEES